MRAKLFCLCIAMFLFPSEPAAQDYYAVNTSNNRFYQINILTGAASLVGPLHVDLGGGGAAFDGNGSLWILFRNPSTGADHLYTVDTSTGHITHVVRLDRLISSKGIVFGPDGTTLYTTDNSQGATLLEVDTVTGVTTVVGNISVAGAFSLTSGPNGAFYLAAQNSLYTIDLGTAVVTLVGACPSTATLAYNSGNAKLYLISSNNLYEVEPSTASSTLVGPLGKPGGWVATAFAPLATVSVEEVPWSSVKRTYR